MAGGSTDCDMLNHKHTTVEEINNSVFETTCWEFGESVRIFYIIQDQFVEIRMDEWNQKNKYEWKEKLLLDSEGS